ncbi:hypothetical protein M427DRAFT_44402 [Gonapodya prolifera JEL478]|uniref:Uncharacterized protein n=1 Tax=Gonapodya prolifera (strain JEL478) TaxID=1344416 RepID=A0A139AGI0_GONPJ|nr:hypothetical protein M427DRAFT_44402 [Gonapodya prolifera JEL478]|eukprot:KXS15555.1 hypothetical protein M427DRAFT_44402 [Gonapodya prolifera JEL478]
MAYKHWWGESLCTVSTALNREFHRGFIKFIYNFEVSFSGVNTLLSLTFSDSALNLGKFSPFVNWVAIAWTVLFCLPWTVPGDGTEPELRAYSPRVLDRSYFLWLGCVCPPLVIGPVMHLSEEDIAALEGSLAVTSKEQVA